MKTFIYPEKETWAGILERPTRQDSDIRRRVGEILDRVRQQGDQALLSLTREIDRIDLSQDGLRVSDMELAQAADQIPATLKTAIETAARNIEKFHRAQKYEGISVETSPGVVCSQRSVPIRKVGLYIPGGTAPLFSTVLMLAIPAKVAGCRQIVLCTPPGKEGTIAPEILYAARLCGIDRMFKAGGAMAVGAMAYGTESVPKVDKIFGPGNQYVTMAKQMVSLYDTAIDMPAGPSEVMVLADETALPEFVAADLLSQLEHGRDSQAILVTTSVGLAEKVQAELARQIASLARKELAQAAALNSRVIVMEQLDAALEIVNEYAPEHLILSVREAETVALRIENAGSIFLGNFTPESAGDYASGTNHTLPTDGWAKSFSGVNLDSFMKKITCQRITADGLRELGPVIETMAQAEGLTAHRNAVTLRLNYLDKKKN